MYALWDRISHFCLVCDWRIKLTSRMMTLLNDSYPRFRIFERGALINHLHIRPNCFTEQAHRPCFNISRTHARCMSVARPCSGP